MPANDEFLTPTELANRLNDLSNQNHHMSHALYALARMIGNKLPDSVYQQLVQDLRTHTNALNTTEFKNFAWPWPVDDGQPAPPDEPFHPEFAVWTGATIGSYNRIEQIADKIAAMKPGRFSQIAWIVKAGEGSSWQREFDRYSPLAIQGLDHLAATVRVGKEYGLTVVPYVNLRARPEWRAGELLQVAQCASVAERTILHVEPGSGFWNGPTRPIDILQWLDDLKRACAAVGAPTDRFAFTSIPRAAQFTQLGGTDTIKAWLTGVQSASWECYGIATAGNSRPQDKLDVDLALPRIRALTENPRHQIPIVQKGELGRWANTEWAAHGLQVWHLDGN